MSRGENPKLTEEELVKALKEERDILQTFTENTGTQLAYLDAEFNFIRVNSAYAKGCGRTIEELIGQNHFALFPNEENQAIFEKVRDTGEPVEFKAKPFEYVDQPSGVSLTGIGPSRPSKTPPSMYKVLSSLW